MNRSRPHPTDSPTQETLSLYAPPPPRQVFKRRTSMHTRKYQPAYSLSFSATHPLDQPHTGSPGGAPCPPGFHCGKA